MSLSNHSNKKLLSIISASNRPHQMRGFFENLNQTVEDHHCLEVLVKIDEGDADMQALMEEAVRKYQFEIRYIVTPRLDGYYTLHYGYQQLFEMSNKDCYFIFPVNEEVRFKTHGWDRVLAKYIKFFADDVFRLKISRLKYRNYYNVYECGPCPENYPFVTRKWMELAGGIGDCWGPDGWHQYIDYHLGRTEGINGIQGLFRSVPIHDILIGGEEAGKELTPQQIKARSQRIFKEWWRMYRIEAQHEFRHIATRMLAYVWAKNEGLEDFDILDDKKARRLCIKDNADGKIRKKFYYHISTAYIGYSNFCFLIKMARRNSVGFVKAFIFPSYGPERGIKKWLDHTLRFFVVLVAIPLSFVTAGDDSIPKQLFLRIYLRAKAIARVLAKKPFKSLKKNI